MFRKALPVGVQDFHEWSDRIISKAGLPATPESQKFALANILMKLPETKAHERDSFFVACLRKSAINQVADAMRITIRDAAKVRLAAEEAKKAEFDGMTAKPTLVQQLTDVTPA